MTTTPGWAEPFVSETGVPGWVDPDEVKATTVSVAGLPLLTTGREAIRAMRMGAITLVDIAGWRDSAPDATTSLPHPSGDGTVALLPRFGPRTVTLRGQIRATTPSAATAAQDRLERVSTGVLLIGDTGGLGVREADVRVTARSFDRLWPTHYEWSLSLIADDPYRFGSATRALTNGANVIPNRGNTGVNPVLDLVGPHGALTITHPGGVYTFAALAAGQRRTLDWRNGDVWAGNVRVFSVEGGRRPIVQSGGSSWTVAGLGSGTATLRRFEAWT